jgi:hypothetical protein
MAINEWKVWKKIGVVKEKKPYTDIDTGLGVIIDFLKETRPGLDKLDRLLNEFRLLRKKELQLKREKKGKDLLRENLTKQIKKYDQIMKAYELLELDTDVNGERIKKIADEVEDKARKLQVDKKLLEKITKSNHWTFDW